jgi:uncharacterized membrane protein YccF (DUF307 family)
MKFKMSGGWWLVICNIIYLIVGAVAIFGYHLGSNDLIITYIQLVWLFVMSLPLWISPIARFCNMSDPWGK